DNPEEFLEHTKLELFQDQVFCFTPKGRLIALPRGANSIDFAYAVHTDVGNTCVGCKINGRSMPLVTELRNGDEVEIVCSEGEAPTSAWQRLTRTGEAPCALRRHRQRPPRHPPRHTRRRPRPIWQARTRDPGARLPAARQDLQ